MPIALMVLRGRQSCTTRVSVGVVCWGGQRSSPKRSADSAWGGREEFTQVATFEGFQEDE